MSDTVRRFVIAAPASGSGKTTLTMVLLAGWKARGMSVQSFKVGPDYIDGTYHSAITGRPAVNLDLWMGGPEDVLRQFARGCRGADLAVVEGVMGLFDSGAPDNVDASTAAVAALLQAPVLLVVDAAKMAESAAAVVHGFHTFPGGPGLGGVVLNRVAGPRHYALLADAIRRATGVPVFGYLPAREALAIPERHLGLVPAVERRALAERARGAVAAAQDTLDWEGLWRLSGTAGKLPIPVDEVQAAGPPVPVALARDEALNFYYAANLDLLTALGAELIPFSPLRGEPIPRDARLLYAGGGFPEEFLPEFQGLVDAHAQYRARIGAGLTTLAECGGYIWLSRALSTADGVSVPLVGAVPVTMQMDRRLTAIGYRAVTALPGGPFPAGTPFRGHEFHYARVVSEASEEPAWMQRGRWGEGRDGWHTARLAAGFTHLYFPSNPEGVRALLDLARAG